MVEINVYDKIMIENPKKEKIWKSSFVILPISNNLF